MVTAGGGSAPPVTAEHGGRWQVARERASDYLVAAGLTRASADIEAGLLVERLIATHPADSVEDTALLALTAVRAELDRSAGASGGQIGPLAPLPTPLAIRRQSLLPALRWRRGRWLPRPVLVHSEGQDGSIDVGPPEFASRPVGRSAPGRLRPADPRDHGLGGQHLRRDPGDERPERARPDPHRRLHDPDRLARAVLLDAHGRLRRPADALVAGPLGQGLGAGRGRCGRPGGDRHAGLQRGYRTGLRRPEGDVAGPPPRRARRPALRSPGPERHHRSRISGSPRSRPGGGCVTRSATRAASSTGAAPAIPVARRATSRTS